MAGSWVAGSVSILVKPTLQNWSADVKKQLASSGMASVGRDIGSDIANPIKDELGEAGKEGGKDAQKAIQKELKDPLKKSKMSLGSRFKKMGKDAGTQFKQNFGSMIKGGLLFAGVAIAGGGALFLKDSVAAASNLEQSMGGIDAVFKESSDAMHQFAADAANDLGLSKNEYNELATLMGTQLKAGGLDGTELTNGVQEMMTLGSDLGSLFGTTTSEASSAISSAFRGEYEPLRAYGVTLSETAIEAQALEMGLIKEGEAMDAASKQAATQALIMEQSADAQGNFGRESDTLANKQQKAAAQFANVKATVGEMLLPALTGLMDVVIEKVLPGFESLVGWVKDELIPAFQDFGGWVEKNSAWLTPLGIVLGVVAGAVLILVAGMAIWAGVTALVAGAQSALNLALLANPITWIVIGVIALVAALIYAYKNSETFRNIVNSVWASIKNAIGVVVDWITGTVWPAIQTAWNAIAAAAIWLYETVILPVWNGIKAAIGAVANWIMGTLVPWLQSAWNAISAAALWLYNSVILPVWNAIKLAIAIVITAVMVYIDLLVWYFNNVVAPVFLWLYNNVVLPVWNGIKSAIAAVVTWFQTVAWPLLASVIDWIKNKFELFKLGLKIIWDFIMNNVINPVIVWFQTVAWPLISSIIDWIKNKFELWKQGMKIIWDYVMNKVINPVIVWFQTVAWPLISKIIDWIKGKFENFKNNLNRIWNFVKNNVINPVISWFRDTVWPLIGRIIDLIKEKFENFKNNLNRIWTFVKDEVINPVVRWFENTVKPLFDTITTGITDAFDTMKGAVQKAWEGIRDTAKVPVEFVVNKIINDAIIGNFNDIAGVFGIDPISEVSLPAGFAAGGYTGPGSKNQAAGVVHADEYVIRKKSQNSIRRVAPGFLDSLNRHGANALSGMGYGYASGGWVKPFNGGYSSNSPYGQRNGRLHAGMDFPTPSGTPMIAVSDGSIVGRGWNSAAGNKLSLQTDMAGIVAGYHHLSSYAAELGQQVKKGDVIGYSGNTGRSSGAHLHFSIKRDGEYVNPNSYLAGTGAAGTGEGGGGWNPFAGLWDSLKDKVREGVGDSIFGDMLFEMPKKIIGGALDWVTDKLTFWDNSDSSGGAEQWRELGKSALEREGVYSQGNLDSMIRRINQESSGDPEAVNNTDINAQNGDPSKGLMQVIGSTFQAYRDKSLPNDQFNPLANMVASIRYTLSRYGSLQGGWDQAGGYSSGGLVKPLLHDQGGYLQPGLSVIENRTRKPEYILNERQWNALYEGRTQSQQRGDTTINQYIRDTDATANAIASGVSWEMKRRDIQRR